MTDSCPGAGCQEGDSAAQLEVTAAWTPLGDHDVDLWIVDLDQAAVRPEWLSAEEHARIDRLLVADKASQLARSHTALRGVLARYAGVHPADLRFELGEHGKPSLLDIDLDFNLSHSDAVAVIAVARRLTLGVDVERVCPDRPLDGMAERFFSAAEHSVFAALPLAQRVEAFYRAWTRKEAYVKALGTGLTFSSRRFTVALTAAGGRLLLTTEMPEDRAERWWFEDLLLPGYQVAICWPAARRRLRRFELDAARLLG